MEYLKHPAQHQKYYVPHGDIIKCNTSNTYYMNHVRKWYFHPNMFQLFGYAAIMRILGYLRGDHNTLIAICIAYPQFHDIIMKKFICMREHIYNIIVDSAAYKRKVKFRKVFRSVRFFKRFTVDIREIIYKNILNFSACISQIRENNYKLYHIKFTRRCDIKHSATSKEYPHRKIKRFPITEILMKAKDYHLISYIFNRNMWQLILCSTSYHVFPPYDNITVYNKKLFRDWYNMKILNRRYYNADPIYDRIVNPIHDDILLNYGMGICSLVEDMLITKHTFPSKMLEQSIGRAIRNMSFRKNSIVTIRDREIISYKKYLKKNYCLFSRVIYGDTDSICVVIDDQEAKRTHNIRRKEKAKITSLDHKYRRQAYNKSVNNYNKRSYCRGNIKNLKR